eukprot:NODE_261_length_11439_cov_1.285538.p8 type:complete len:211 gc:universal NODE_261_length_11439_cov_1.285538:6605-7237(+)
MLLTFIILAGTSGYIMQLVDKLALEIKPDTFQMSPNDLYNCLSRNSVSCITNEQLEQVLGVLETHPQKTVQLLEALKQKGMSLPVSQETLAIQSGIDIQLMACSVHRLKKRNNICTHYQALSQKYPKTFTAIKYFSIFGEIGVGTWSFIEAASSDSIGEKAGFGILSAIGLLACAISLAYDDNLNSFRASRENVKEQDGVNVVTMQASQV